MASNLPVIRIRWSDPQDDPSVPVAWKCSALLIATLFLNFPFWLIHAPRFRMNDSLAVHACLVLCVVAALSVLFFLGPALAVSRSRQPLLQVVANSVGSYPAQAVRLACIWFLVLWITGLLALPLWQLDLMLRRDVSTLEKSVVAVFVLSFLCWSAIKGPVTSARLAQFSIRFGIAVLVAAFLRVRDGWPAILEPFPLWEEYSTAAHTIHGFSALAYYFAPLALLAAGLFCGSQTRRQILLTGTMGAALPLFVVMLAVGCIEIATGASRFYRPSLQPTVGMALSSHVASSAMPGRLMLWAITIFGAARFGMKAVAAALPLSRRPRHFAIAVAAPALIWFSLNAEVPGWSLRSQIPAGLLIVASAVLSADLLMQKHSVHQPPSVDWVGTLALLIGFATYVVIRSAVSDDGPHFWWHPWLLPAYLTAFLVTILGRYIARSPYN